MAGRMIPVRVGDVELLVETVAVGGSEQTSRLGDAADRVVDAFGAAEAAIVALAGRVAEAVAASADHVVRPTSLEVEFGLKFSAHGQVVVAGASGEASLKVTVAYKS